MPLDRSGVELVQYMVVGVEDRKPECILGEEVVEAVVVEVEVEVEEGEAEAEAKGEEYCE